MAQYDGEIRIKTKIDESGAKAGVKSLKSQAATLAAEYRRSGMSQSDAFKKAWSEIERTSKQGSNKVKGDVNTITDAFKGMGTALIGIFSLKAAIEYMQGASKAAINLESNMIRTAEIFGDSNKVITDFAENSAFALGMSQKAAYEYAATYGNLFSMIAKDQAENAELSKQYLQASAVIASKTGRSVDDVMSRIRSGILGNTEAIEDVGINVNVAMLEMTESFKKIADGRSWEKLNFYEQQQIRTLAILEQANRKYGNEVMNSSAFATQRFAAAMENLKTTFGGFLNVAVVPVINALTTLAVLLNNVLTAMFGETIKTQAQLAQNSNKAAAGQTKLGDATTKAAKAAKNSLAAFDDLNILQKDMADSSKDAAAGAAGAIGASLTIDTKKMETEKFKLPPGLKDFTTAILELQKAIQELMRDIDYLWNSTGVKQFAEWASSEFMTKTIEHFTGAVMILSGVLDILSGSIQIVTGIFKGDFATSVQGAQKIFEGAMEVIRGTAQTVFGADLVNAVSGFITYWKEQIFNWFTIDVMPWFTKEKWSALWTNTKTGMTEGWKKVTDWWAASGSSYWFNTYVKPWFTAERWKLQWDNVKLAFNTKWTEIVTWWNKSGPTMWWINNVMPWFTKEKWSIMLDNVKMAFVSTFDAIGAGIKSSMKNAVNGAIDMLNGAISEINKFKVDLPDWIPEFGGQSIGFSIPKIPKLAKGAVIAPNKPFLAELGDQPSGINIETPLETMIDAFKTALSGMTQQGGGGEAVLVVDGKELGRVMLPHVNSAQKRIGVSLVSG